MRDRAEQTRSKLVSTARGMFADIGFHATATSALARRAGLTRGALYHHFRDKREVFEAAFQAVASGLNERTSAAAGKVEGNTWDRVVEAFSTYLHTVAEDPEVQQILLIDGPTVLGWQRWRELQYEYIASGVVATLEMLIREGEIPAREPEPLAWLIQAALADAALEIANAGDKARAEQQSKAAFLYLLEGLRRPGSNRM